MPLVYYMATILMKLSEGKAANQYDRWIGLLTLWQNTAMREHILHNILPHRGRVLDIGCGTGKLLIEAGRRGIRGVGVDMNGRMLAIARQNCIRQNLGRRLKFIDGNALHLSLTEQPFDLVVSTLMISELQPEELENFIAHISKFVRSGGIVAIGGESKPTGTIIGGMISIIRRISYGIVSRVTELSPHPYHDVLKAMRIAGLVPKYKILFMKGLLTLYVAEAS
jgi:ubiquinone/menaquinone biosynthesis C-methylase UbiE